MQVFERRLSPRAAGGKLVDSNATLEKRLQQELSKVAKSYGGGEGTDMTKFPAFSFKGGHLECYVGNIPLENCQVLIMNIIKTESCIKTVSFLLLQR